MNDQVFDTYLNTEATRKVYRYWCRKFQEFHNESFEEILTLARSQQETRVTEYLMMHKDKGTKGKSFQAIIASLEFYFSMNDVLLNWKKLKKVRPRIEKPTGSETWRDQDIREMVKVAGSNRNRALVYFMKDTGGRRGAVPTLRIRNFYELDDGYCTVRMYEGDKEEYFAFLVPESFNALKAYWKERRGVKDDSFAFENHKHKTRSALTESGVSQIIERIIAKLPDNPRIKESEDRYNIQTVHGFRKWTSSKFKRVLQYETAERLQGHFKGTDWSYVVGQSHREVKDKVDDTFREFLKVAPDLIIDENIRLEEEHKRLKELKNDEIESLVDKKLANFMNFQIQANKHQWTQFQN